MNAESQPDREVFEFCWDAVVAAKLRQLSRVRTDLMTWRRGSALIALQVNPDLGVVTIYSVLVTGVEPSLGFFRHLLEYNILQRRECLGFIEKHDQYYVVMKHTIELELATPEGLQRNIYAFQEIADKVDTELAAEYGGTLNFDDWEKMDQSEVDNLLDDLFA